MVEISRERTEVNKEAEKRSAWMPEMSASFKGSSRLTPACQIVTGKSMTPISCAVRTKTEKTACLPEVAISLLRL